MSPQPQGRALVTASFTVVDETLVIRVAWLNPYADPAPPLTIATAFVANEAEFEKALAEIRPALPWNKKGPS